jgi:transcription elongation GreA/GreB family factor
LITSGGVPSWRHGDQIYTDRTHERDHTGRCARRTSELSELRRRASLIIEITSKHKDMVRVCRTARDLKRAAEN